MIRAIRARLAGLLVAIIAPADSLLVIPMTAAEQAKFWGEEFWDEVFADPDEGPSKPCGPGCLCVIPDTNPDGSPNNG